MAVIDDVINTYTCGICMDEKTKEEIFTTTNCSISTTGGHRSFCRDCMSKHIAAKIYETEGASVRCPEPMCSAALEPQGCGALAASLPDELLVWWEAAACESLVRSVQRSCCPFEDCGAPLDHGDPAAVECSGCGRLFCPACRELWHPVAACLQARRRRRRRRKRKESARDGRGKDVKYLDRKFKGLVKSKNWKRCPSCKIYVEKQFGCEHITCRCFFEFCYMCGKEWKLGHDCPFRFIRRQIMRMRAMLKNLSILCSCSS